MPARVPDRALVRAALESGALRLVEPPTDPWFGTHARVGERCEVRYTNTLVVRAEGLTVDEQLLWAAAVSDGEGGTVPEDRAVRFDAPTTTGDPPRRARSPHRPAAPAAVPAHLPPERFELWQLTLPDRTRGCLPAARAPAARQFKRMVSLHVFTGDSLPNVRISHEGTMHITGCLHLGLVGELLRFLHGLPGIRFATDTRFFVDTVLTNVRFPLGYDVDRWVLRQVVNAGDGGQRRWSAVYEPQSEHVAVSVSCRTDAPVTPDSPLPCFSLGRGWTTATVGAMLGVLRPGAQPRRKVPRHTFRVFANGTVTFACVWPPELEPVFADFAVLMERVRQRVAFARPGT